MFCHFQRSCILLKLGPTSSVSLINVLHPLGTDKHLTEEEVEVERVEVEDAFDMAQHYPIPRTCKHFFYYQITFILFSRFSRIRAMNAPRTAFCSRRLSSIVSAPRRPLPGLYGGSFRSSLVRSFILILYSFYPCTYKIFFIMSLLFVRETCSMGARGGSVDEVGLIVVNG